MERVCDRACGCLCLVGGILKTAKLRIKKEKRKKQTLARCTEETQKPVCLWRDDNVVVYPNLLLGMQNADVSLTCDELSEVSL